MLRDGLPVSYLNLIDEQDIDYFRYTFGDQLGNPQNLPNTHNLVLDGTLYGPHPEIARFLKDLSPDLMIGMDSIATLLLKREAPQQPIIFVTVGCQSLQNLLVKNGQKDLISYRESFKQPLRRSLKLNEEELAAVQLSDLVVTHSEVIKEIFTYFYPRYSGKLLSDVIWFAEWIHGEALIYSHLRRDFTARDVEVLFVASSWMRFEKNYELIGRIGKRIGPGKIHVAGNVNHKFPEVAYHGLVTSRENLFALMGRSKTICCPSLFDAAPGILFEASALGCNVVASKNCGNWQLCNSDLLVEPFALDQFVEKLTLSATRKFDDNIELFLAKGSYQSLLETLAVM
jgi:glycosyltransferase involved in cell wall biosynthesis